MIVGQWVLIVFTWEPTSSLGVANNNPQWHAAVQAEYKAIANVAAELSWFKSILHELGLPLQRIPTLWCDNIGATYLTSNPKFHARTKDIEIDFHFVRDKMCNKELVVQFISSKDQLADALTKPLPPIKFRQVQINLNVRELPSKLRGV